MTSMRLRVALGFALLCLVGGSAAMVAGMGSLEERLPLQFDPQPFVIPEAIAQIGEHDIAVDVVNDADEPARIVGVTEFCASLCFYGRGLPLTIPAKGRSSLTIHVQANAPGPVSEQVEFFTDRPTQPKLTLRLEGNIRGTPSHEITTNHAANR